MDELPILQALRDRQRYRTLIAAVPRDSIGQEATLLLDWFALYFQNYTEHQHVDLDALMSLIKLRNCYDKEQMITVTHLVNLLRKPIDQAAVKGIVGTLHELDLAGRAQAILLKYKDGDEVDITYELGRLANETLRAVNRSSPASWIDDPINEILEREAGDFGLKLPTHVLREHVKGVLGGANIALGARPDKGKCLAPDTPVLLASGKIIPAKMVRVGDVLAGPYRNNTVMGVTTGRDTMYRITYPWGDSYVVNSAHILSLKRSKTEGTHRCGDVINVNVEEYISWPDSRKARYKGWKSAVDYPPQDLCIDPYLLGVWLGDGTSNKPQITTQDSSILDAFVAQYGQPTRVDSKNTGAATTYDFYRTSLLPSLRRLDLLNDKHIPEQYMISSREQRLSLLAGIIDSDGYAGDVYEIVTKSDRLMADYVRLARSLGFHAVAKRTFKKAVGTSHQGAWYWRVRIGAEAFGVVPVRLPHKRGNERARKRQGLHFGIKVECIGTGDYAGFSLDGDHLFLLGDYTVTHNTSLLAFILTHFATQQEKFFEPERPILWLNNEGSGKRIIPRVYQAALGKTYDEIVALSNSGKLTDAYTKKIGRADRIRVKDMHGASLAQIEQVVESMRPCVVAFDMLANFRLAGAASGGNKADEVEQKWQEVREMAVRHDFVAISTVQVSADGDNMLYPPYSALKDSKTGIQGATDLILIMGALNDPKYQGLRGISTAKNKYQMPGKPSHVEADLVFDPERCIFSDGG